MENKYNPKFLLGLTATYFESEEKRSWTVTNEDITGDDYRLHCPKCGKGFLVPIWIINRWGKVSTNIFLSMKTGYAFDTS